MKNLSKLVTEFGARRGAERDTRSLTIIAMVLAAAVAPACSSDGKGDGPATESDLGQVNGNLLASISDGSQHRVDFYDFGFGLRGVRETRGESDPSWFSELKNQGQSLTALYHFLRPQEQTPPVIRDADARGDIESARIEAAPPGTPITDVVKPLPGLVPPALPASEKPASSTGEETVSQTSSALTVCSSDVYQDNWGAQWFRNTFPNEPFGSCNGFTQYPTQTNIASKYMQLHAGQNYQWWQFEGDFNNSGASNGSWNNPGGLRNTLWSATIAPRTLQRWFISGGSSSQLLNFAGSSPCSHMDYTLVYCMPLPG